MFGRVPNECACKINDNICVCFEFIQLAAFRVQSNLDYSQRLYTQRELIMFPFKFGTNKTQYLISISTQSSLHLKEIGKNSEQISAPLSILHENTLNFGKIKKMFKIPNHFCSFVPITTRKTFQFNFSKRNLLIYLRNGKCLNGNSRIRWYRWLNAL